MSSDPPLSHWSRLRANLGHLRAPPTSPSTRMRNWTDRRTRLALRRYGPIKDEVLRRELTSRASTADDHDEVDGLLNKGLAVKAEIVKAKKTLYGIAKDSLWHARRRQAREEEEQHDKSFSLVEPAPDVTDDASKREFGVGRLGDLLHWRQEPRVAQQPHVRYQLDDFSDHRPYFTYWVSFIQTLILIVAVASYGFAPFGAGLWKTSGLVLSERLALEEVSVRMPFNFWLGPKAKDLVHLGAKHAPCMRRDGKVFEGIEAERKFEAENTGCCIRNDNSGCLQTTEKECSTLLSQFQKWTTKDPGPDTRLSGPVCGLDPRFCLKGGSSAWPDDISRWPSCGKPIDSRLVEMPEHLTCEVLGRPCCVGIHGKCELHSREFCSFVHGTFHQDASLCSQVSCMGDVCGMLPFAKHDVPDQFYRLWTSLFLCAGIIHLVIILAFQLYLMADLEKMCGWWRLALIYFVSGIVGNLASAVFVPYRAETGPSGAIFGVMATFIVEVLKAWDILRSPMMALTQQLLIIGLFILAGFAPWVDNYAHVFGFCAGLLLAHGLLPSIDVHPQQEEDGWQQWMKNAIVYLCFAVTFFLFVVLAVVFYFAPYGECEICKWFSCIPILDDFCAEQNIDFEVKGGIF